MCHSKIKSCGLFALLCVLVVTGCLTAKNNPPAANPVPLAGLSPGPNDARIAYLTPQLMENLHYSTDPLDKEISKKFFDGYIESLDPRRENFLQSDIDGFAGWRTNLDTLTVNDRGEADLTPAFQVFQRFLERQQQHETYVEELLKTDKFKFTGDDRILIDRRQAPYPKDMAEAQELWRERLRYEYLQEKISREISPTNDDVITSLTKSNLTDIADTLARHYRWNFHMATNWDSTDVLQTYLEALTHAYDPHSDYQNFEHAQDFSIQMSLSLFGIGAQLIEDDGYCTISKLIPGGPAAKSKQLNENDRIVAVAQGSQPPVDVVDMELGKVVQLIRGPKGTEVRLTISPADDRAMRRVVTMIRDEIKLEDSEAKATLIERPDGHGGTNRIGIIDVPSFYTPIDLPGNAGHSKQSFISVDVAKLVKKLKQEKVAGIILDMRSNPGGSLEEAVNLTGLFIKSGPVVLARESDGRVAVDADNDPAQLYDGPLAVLVNRLSASASEISAAALQDYGRALIIGDTSTFGKGTVQKLVPLRNYMVNSTNDPGTVKITISKFYRVTGASTQFKGVVPDIILPDKLSYSPDLGEAGLENPLPWDTIAPADFDKLNMVAPYVAGLRLRSEARTATNQEFNFIRQDIQEFQKQLADKTVPLNEREAIKEREDHQALLNSHAQARLAQKTPDVKVYEITVENAGEPLQATNAVSENAETNSLSGAVGNKPAKIIGNDVVEFQSGENARLNEAENIFEDYISLMSSNRPLIAK